MVAAVAVFIWTIDGLETWVIRHVGAVLLTVGCADRAGNCHDTDWRA
jgi:hypothetical protein